MEESRYAVPTRVKVLIVILVLSAVVVVAVQQFRIIKIQQTTEKRLQASLRGQVIEPKAELYEIDDSGLTVLSEDPKIAMAIVTNRNVRVYHVVKQLSKIDIGKFGKHISGYDTDQLNKAGKQASELVKEVLSIPGINSIFIKPYELTVIKAQLFQWKDIEKEVVEALSRIYQNGKNRNQISEKEQEV